MRLRKIKKLFRRKGNNYQSDESATRTGKTSFPIAHQAKDNV